MSTTAAEPEIWVNDEPRRLPPEATLQALMEELKLAEKKGVAAAVNGAVVPRSGWTACRLTPRDRVLVIRATQGG